MSPPNPPKVRHPRNARSAITNGTILLDGIDGRSPQARRYRDLMRDFAAELGGVDRLSQAQLAMVRQVAAITVQSEAMQADIVNGKPVDAEQLVRVSNLLARLIKNLGIGQGKLAASPRTLADHLRELEA